MWRTEGWPTVMINPFEIPFRYLEDQTGFSIDQVRYIVLLLLSYPLAIVLRHALHPNHTPIIVRHVYTLVVGVAMGLICFGWIKTLFHVLFISVGYFLLIFASPQYVQRYSMVWALSFMSVVHIYRLITDYGGYHLDFSGPVMVMVQKISQTAYALHDGKARAESQLSRDQQELKLVAPPTPLQYFSYMFNFLNYLAGPNVTYRDYQDFIDGSNFRGFNKNSTSCPALSKLLLAVVSISSSMYLVNYVDNNTVLDPQYYHPLRLLLNYANSVRLRGEYYFIWLLTESINITGGYGYCGQDKNGRAKWDLATNVKLWDIEFGTSLRTVVNGWNSHTHMWLRRCVYERATFAPTLVTFAVSAWWHGFYPGYYFAFLYMGAAILAARKMRRLLHHHFQGNPFVERVYDILTWAVAHVYLDTGIFCSTIKFAQQSIIYWSYLYYFPVISSVVIAMFFPSGRSQVSMSKLEDEGRKHASVTKKHIS